MRDPFTESYWIGLLAIACVALFWIAMMVSAFLPEELRASLPRPTLAWALFALGLIVAVYVLFFIAGARLDRVDGARAATGVCASPRFLHASLSLSQVSARLRDQRG
jgi:hypothetical protein